MMQQGLFVQLCKLKYIYKVQFRNKVGSTDSYWGGKIL